ncbi:permease [Candidatus Micrarchaeota archaeon]|nr:permease [Candidatus Micrarchaeota archaeon]
MKEETDNKTLYFMMGSIFLFLLVTFSTNSWDVSLNRFFSIIFDIIPIFILVFILFVLTDYFIDPKKLVKLIEKKHNAWGWFIAGFAGIISTGPIYMWYPLLNEMQKNGVKNSLISIFLYNRAIKPALLPMLIFYFGLTYTIVLTVVMFSMSILNGLVVEKILDLEVIKSRKDL